MDEEVSADVMCGLRTKKCQPKAAEARESRLSAELRWPRYLRVALHAHRR